LQTTPPPSSPLRSLAARLRVIDPVLGLVFLVLVLHYVGTRGIFEGKASGDGVIAFLYFPGLVYHHTFDLSPVALPHIVSSFGREPASGLVANPNPIGPPLLWVPFYGLVVVGKWLIGGALALIGAHAPSGLVKWYQFERLHHGEFDYWLTGLGTLLFGLVGVSRLFVLLRRRLSLGAARFAVAASVLASPLWWYLTTQPLYQHGCAFFAVTLFVERWDAYRSQSPDGYTLRHAAILGALGGLCLLMRTQQGLWLILPAADLLTAFLRGLFATGLSPDERRRRVGQAVLAGLVFAVCLLVVFSPQALLWKHYYGSIRPPQRAGHIRWHDPALVAMLFSMRAGLFPWIPILYLVVPGLLWLLWRRSAGLALPLCLILVFAGQVYVNAAVYDFHASWAFGPRRFTECVVVLGLGLAGLWQACGRRGRKALLVCAILAIVWNGFLIELVRQRRVKSSSSGAYPASVWVRWAQGPAWLGRAFDRVGFPFAQPAGLIFGLIHGVPIRTFEGIVGNHPLERDIGHREIVSSRTIHFNDIDRTYVVSGIEPPTGASPAVHPIQPEVRLLVPLRAREPLRLHIIAQIKNPAAIGLRWNGAALPVRERASGLVVEVPEALTRSHARVNELVLSGLTPDDKLYQLDFESLGTWWR
jgi:hypothetical protein